MKILVIMFILYGIKGDQISDLKKELDYQINLLKKDFENKLDTYKQDIENQLKNNKQSTCDSDWISYTDRKCYKVLEKKGSETEAKTNCSQLDKSSTLITIQSKEEQIFVQNFLKNYSNISNFVWIGLEYFNKTFQWMDGNELQYQNWDENAEKDGNNKCAQMSITIADLGKWSDDNCKKNYLMVCQKKQSSKSVLNEEIQNITKVIEKQQKAIEKQEIHFEGQQQTIEKIQNTIDDQQKKINSLIPLGFLYTQFPNQSTPQKLWPNMKWSEVTQQYAGLFFRAEGSGSGAFGQVEQANYPSISQFKYENCQLMNNGLSAVNCQTKIHSMSEGDWSDINYNDLGHGNANFKFYKTSGENRPRNTAIKIWKRI